jgi:hypothetical protein
MLARIKGGVHLTLEQLLESLGDFIERSDESPGCLSATQAERLERAAKAVRLILADEASHAGQRKDG